MWVITPARGLFYCFDAKVGGDCLAVVQPLVPYRGCSHFRQRRAEESGCDQKETAFDPVAVGPSGAAGLYEQAAKDFSIGFYRGQVYMPIRHLDGSINGFVGTQVVK
jgi:hypothetical protein